MVILRSDGTPTYNVVGRGGRSRHGRHPCHPRRRSSDQRRAPDADLSRRWAGRSPVFAHVPLIHGPDGAKLSKRHGALGVEAYRDMGYLPEALRNYLVRLGWSHGDDEIMSTEEVIRWFDLRRHRPLGRALRLRQAREFERALYPRDAGRRDRAAAAGLVPELPDGAELAARIDAEGWAKLERAMPGLKERAKTLVELLDNRGLPLRQAAAPPR